MAGKRRQKGNQSSGTSTKELVTWSGLTWDDLDRWAGSRSLSRGRTYQRGGRVKDLVVSSDGKLLATVTGGRRYVTSVWLRTGGSASELLESKCSCPVGASGCKHAVAVVAAYLEVLAEDNAVPLADDDDPRWHKLSAASEESDDEYFDDDLSYEDEEEDEDDVYDEEEALVERPRRKRPKAQTAKTRGQWDQRIEEHVRARSREELADLVCSLVTRFPELRTEFQERIALAEGDVERLVAQARKELRQVTSEIGWHNSWSGEGHTPDYDRLKQRLMRLAEMGHGDRVVELGRELIERGFAQIGQSDDEGETGTALAECLPVVFDAVAKSRLTPCQKLLFAIDACLADDYGIIYEEADAILEADWQPADWSAVADALAKRLRALPEGKKDEQWSRNYRRDCISHWLLDVLQRAGREGELLGIYEAEARTTGSYERLVKYLIDQKRIEDAERWAREGIEQTKSQLPGIADNLTKLLVEVAAKRKDWKIVAAHAACHFYVQPGVDSFKELLAAARKAKCEESVQPWGIKHLETGAVPWKVKKTKSGPLSVTVDPDWPLPLPDFLVPLLRFDAPYRGPDRPHFGVLLEMAIAEKRTDDVLRWYDQLEGGEKSKTSVGFGWTDSFSYGDQVAAAVAKSHPERALAIYRRRLEGNLKRADVSAYEAAADYLRKMRPILKALGRDAEWAMLLVDIRQRYKNRPRFMEILDKLEQRPIVETHRARRRR